jgi:hypothetical protein
VLRLLDGDHEGRRSVGELAAAIEDRKIEASARSRASPPWA